MKDATPMLLGQKAPPFSLKDQGGKTHNLSDYQGNRLIVYFYPRDDTPGCTKEACSFRDTNELYQAQGIKVIGISKDSVQSHKKFAQKYQLTYPLLSDESKQTIKAYGAWGVKNFMGRNFEGILRKTFVIDTNGVIKKIYPKVIPVNHAQEILNDLSKIV